MGFLALLLLPIQVVVGLGLAYHYILLVAGSRRLHVLAHSESVASRRFAIALPAHNEASVIGRTVALLRNQDYLADQFDIHVVADYCDDATAEVARAAGAVVHERREGLRGRKGYALIWLLNRLLNDPRHYDAIVVFDADSQVSPQFLKTMNQALSAGAQVVQGRHVISNPGASIFSTLADADMRLNNRIRNQAKENLGLSTRLMGDAMCFCREVLETYPWVGAQSLVEDRVYGIYLVTRGLRIRFAPEALSKGEATLRWRDATGQRLRWYGGGLELQKLYLGRLLQSAWRDHNLCALDLALELALPSFSTLAMLAVGLVVLGAVPGIGNRMSFVSALSAFMAFAYPFLGLLAEQAPLKSFAVLLYGPVYVVWRVWLALWVRLQRDRVAWIRTRRMDEVR